jgi:hypothetical protein
MADEEAVSSRGNAPAERPLSRVVTRGLHWGVGRSELEAMAERFFSVREPQLWHRTAAADQARALHAAVQAYQNPLAPGMTKEDLRARVLPDSPPFLLDALLGSSGKTSFFTGKRS